MLSWSFTICALWWSLFRHHGYGQRINVFAEKNDLAGVAADVQEISKVLQSGLPVDTSLFSAKDAFYNANTVCRALRNGTLALIGLADTESSNQLGWYSRALHIPVVIRSSYDPLGFSDEPIGPYHFNVRPSTIHAVLDVITQGYSWTEAFYITDSNTKSVQAWEAYNRQAQLRSIPNKLYGMFFQGGSLVSATEYITTTILRRPIKEWRMILDLPTNMSIALITAILRNGAVRERHFHFVLTALDTEGADFRIIHSSVSSLTVLSMMEKDQTSSAHRHVVTTADALAYDAIGFVMSALRNSSINTKSLDCRAMPYNVWAEGSRVHQLLLNTHYTGLTGKLEFDKLGNRRNYKLNILQMRFGAPFINRGTWSDIDRLHFLPLPNTTLKRTLRIVGILAERFLMVVPCDTTTYRHVVRKEVTTDDSECYAGFVVDLILQLTALTNYTFTLHHNSGKLPYGNKVDGRWTGAIGEVLRKEADMIVADLSTTSDREQVVDFTLPFMNDDYYILIRKEETIDLGIFSFLRPFSLTLWLAILLAIVGTFVVIFFGGRIGPSEWHLTEPCDPENDDGIFNDYTVEESLWFTIATLLQQGPNIEPRSVATKIAVGSWFIWVLIVSQTYTAKLAAFLTIDRMKSSIQTADDLSNSDTVQYGYMKMDYAASNFFQHTQENLYQRMQIAMVEYGTIFEDFDSVMAKVRQGSFAIIGPKTMVGYINNGRPCDTRLLGLPLFTSSYALAMSTGSPLRKEFSEAVVRLKEHGVMKQLESTWFGRTTNECRDEDEDQDHQANPDELSKLNPHEMTGLFIVLAAGLGLALVVAFCEYLCKGRQEFRHHGVSMGQLLLTERRPKSHVATSTHSAKATPASRGQEIIQ
ncbi:glutamate receptor-like [Paramacrobiotus metropolitanus]|uniref:glutamate receptor-like n=1 Tax=Paramacrobiotus metropolitanus TaxID=2943436 RepID=UPI00244644D1|nr:glutamate receptor-like [Paramacrobiotus metropolitanus]